MKNLYQDHRRKRPQARTGFLPRVRHVGLFNASARSAVFHAARGHDQPAHRTAAESAAVVPVRTRLGHGSSLHRAVLQATFGLAGCRVIDLNIDKG